MPPTLSQLGIDKLTLEDRLAVAEAIWESVISDPEGHQLTSEERSEIERRLALSEADPTRGVAWEVVREEARARYGRD
jgi:putative addiction module component (TIGR02574 family)